MQKTKKKRKNNFKKAGAQKFREYDQKMEALTNFNVSEASEKVVQANVLAEIKKLLPTHIPKAVANYVRPRLNTSVLDKDELTTTDLKEIGLETLKQQYKNDVELECHVGQLKAAVLIEAKWNSDEDDRSDDKEYEFSYADLPRLSLNDVEDHVFTLSPR
ncbi:hypothetical protein Tco_1142802 [Tanacetum coccineum]